MGRVDRLKEERKKRKKGAISFVKDIVIAIVLSSVVLFCISPSQVRERSMQPTINDKDIVLINKAFYKNMQRGDIIVFRSDLKDENGKEMRLIKRIIGLEGDKITIDNKKVYVNGKALDEPYIYEDPTGGDLNYVHPKDFIVPKDQIYVLGDHREVSRDSRQLGAIDKERVVGKAFFRVLPIKDIGILN